MSNICIVAIPAEDDKVWQYSSEKVPHMTLLFLGEEVENLKDVQEFLFHVASVSFNSFGMSVDHRGILGDKDADVLFFEKTHSYRALLDFRSQLLSNTNIYNAYHSTEQFPEWTPHLTMGYPKTPAKKIDFSDHLSWVHFDRIALWVSDYSGPEFRLKNYDDYAIGEVTMSQAAKTFLEHFGVKGMKWGVRNDRGHEGERATNKKIAKEDAKFEKMIGLANKGRLTPAFHNAIVQRLNARTLELNDSDKYRDVNIATATGKIKDDYNRDAQDVIMRSFEDATREQYGSNASGTKRAIYNRETDRIDVVENKKETRHSDVHPIVPDVSIKLKRNKTGHIIGQIITVLDDSLQQIDSVDDFIKHFGVKGMKWGVRKNKHQVPDGETLVTQRKPGEKVTAEGGRKVPASLDAMKAASSRQRAKYSTTDALSTQDLQELVMRMNLEKQYAKLTSAQINPGRKFVNDQLTSFAKQQFSQFVNKQGQQLLTTALKKRAASFS